MSLVNGGSSTGASKASQLPMRGVLLFTIAVVACATYFWLVGGHNVHNLQQLPASKVLILRAFRLLIAAFVLYSLLISRVKRWVYSVGHGGEFDRALRLNRLWSWLPFYGSSLEGPILFNAGRYSEALEYLRPLAFDHQGQPRLTSVELYTYAISLVNSGREAEAQPLLEAACSVPRKGNTMQVALATCLLTQNKEPERARQLLEESLSDAATLSRADLAKRVARYAYALGACGRRQDAETQIQKALAMGATLKQDDLAGVDYFVGEAWQAMGETTKARAAYQEAVTLSRTA